ncbi:lysozyme inhibitor LprI family protein [Bradyrhizobium oropedii]|uniref:lysozyme inhibitor LprI family protein n=1 Tax=Bradyrhizobium oropedii TaxID=1571201 RepID=UPI00308457A5
MTFKYGLVGLLVIIAPCAHAQSDDEMAACVDRSDGVSSRMLDCGKTEIDKWDARLNAAYQLLLHRESGAGRAKLQAEQKAWLHHHLSETRRLASDPDAGSGAFMTSQSFELDDIAKRTRELERLGNAHRSESSQPLR